MPCDVYHVSNFSEEPNYRDCNIHYARIIPESEVAQSTTYALTGETSLLLSRKKGGIPILTSKLIPVNKGDNLTLDMYAFSPTLRKATRGTQIAKAAVGGIVAGVALTPKSPLSADGHNADLSLPVVGVGTFL